MVYLLTYTSALGTETDIKEMLNSCEDITDWRTDMPHTFLISSDASANVIADFIISQNKKARFIITEIDHNRQGWLPRAAWDFIRDNY